ncbi:hypothetical protein FYJ27_12345 [Anaerosalibacter bizertensis]|uniref:Uncharacterized protein n=1 Tax=Anaerosalibacter bizertensis TaxID=932217 RepID=A0A844FJZ8_9FIRM|nr:hypothetical protein [Anaerosalibacter bizertensis]MBV1818960.1 hypothetical protein [Bacteroidales bacterium MSK.15.36]MBU5294211.1 hypothetical protein [Anaerosalibacter bizertensis]MCB5559955.1 hypothetical protein [Anaerosalibacter bizertensis]MCG4565798.1 hypothetical protein [Anaerosalibacter bizertensis]MCG4583070.1 hypothetical protein [Anaerosalibacter bizertensis]
MKKVVKRVLPLTLAVLLFGAPVLAYRSGSFQAGGKPVNCTLSPNFNTNSANARTYWANGRPKGYRLNTRIYLRYSKNMALEKKNSVTHISDAKAYAKGNRQVQAFKSIHSYINPNQSTQREMVHLFEGK